MPPRGFTNPAPKTESAREARKAFFCELCQKGYSRINEFEAHENSYDHQHKKRLRDMKAMQRDPQASDKARRAERRLDERGGGGLISIRPVRLDGSSTAAATASPAPAPRPRPTTQQPARTGGGGGFKKGGFKSAFGGGAEAAGPKEKTVREEEGEEEEEELGYERYDPRRPTGCSGACGVR